MPNGLTIRPAEDCRWDIVALGEVMLRFDPGEDRIRSAHAFRVWEGGGEYNVARAIASTFGLRAALVSALPDNELGQLALGLIRRSGVDARYIAMLSDQRARMGLNFTERGFGPRAPRACSDRTGSAASRIKPGDVDWDRLFRDEGVRWLHTGGIFAALTPDTEATAIAATAAARRHGTIVSYDVNYRPSLARAPADRSGVRASAGRLLHNVDVLFAHEGDIVDRLAVDVAVSPADVPSFASAVAALMRDHPHIRLVAKTDRVVRSASAHDWAAECVWEGRWMRSVERSQLDIFDRVGGGDGFAAGLIHGCLEGESCADALERAAALGALAMSTLGDGAQVDQSEVDQLVSGIAPSLKR